MRSHLHPWWKDCALLGDRPDSNGHCWDCGLDIGKYWIGHPIRQPDPVMQAIEQQLDEAAKENSRRAWKLWEQF